MFDEIHDDIYSSNIRRFGGSSRATQNSLSQSLSDDYFPNVHDVLVSAGHECIYLPQSGDGKPMLFFFEFKLLERDDIPGLYIASTEDNSIRALFNLVQPLVIEHGTGWKNGRMARPRWNTHAMKLVRRGCGTRSRWLCWLRRGGGRFALRKF